MFLHQDYLITKELKVSHMKVTRRHELVDDGPESLQPFNNWLDGTREDLVDMFIVHTLDEIQGLIDAHAQFKATLPEADKEFQSIISLIHEVENFARQFNVPGATLNPYTNLTGNVSPASFQLEFQSLSKCQSKNNQKL